MKYADWLEHNLALAPDNRDRITITMVNHERCTFIASVEAECYQGIYGYGQTAEVALDNLIKKMRRPECYLSP